jgi:hypothetical protein
MIERAKLSGMRLILNLVVLLLFFGAGSYYMGFSEIISFSDLFTVHFRPSESCSTLQAIHRACRFGPRRSLEGSAVNESSQIN